MVSLVLVRNALVTAAFWLVHASASAAPPVLVEGDAHCPERTAVQREIRQFTVQPAPDEPHFRLEIGQLPRGARADLFGPDGERLFSRRIESEDCEALARAFALILRAHFVDLGMVKNEPAGTATDHDGEAEAEAEALPASPPPPPTTRETPPSFASAESPKSDSWGFRVGAGVGIGHDVPEGGPMLAGVVQAGTVTAGGLWLGLHVWGASPVRVGSPPDRVQRWPFGLELGASGRFFQTWFFEPGVSAGVQLTRVRAVDIDGGARLSPVPVARAALRGGLVFSSVCPWLELSGRLLLDRDRYVVRPRRPIGLGPRATLLLVLGADMSWF